jgi:hypothetical protein
VYGNYLAAINFLNELNNATIQNPIFILKSLPWTSIPICFVSFTMIEGVIKLIRTSLFFKKKKEKNYSLFLFLFTGSLRIKPQNDLLLSS